MSEPKPLRRIKRYGIYDPKARQWDVLSASNLAKAKEYFDTCTIAAFRKWDTVQQLYSPEKHKRLARDARMRRDYWERAELWELQVEPSKRVQ